MKNEDLYYEERRQMILDMEREILNARDYVEALGQDFSKKSYYGYPKEEIMEAFDKWNEAREKYGVKYSTKVSKPNMGQETDTERELGYGKRI